MSDQRTFRLRVTYAIKGRLHMLSHLEMARALERIVRRAKLPFAITNGFSPHMKISFGGALPVGVGGTEEIFDIYLKDYLSPDRAQAMLEGATVPDIEILKCEYIEASAKAASVAFPRSTYIAYLSEPIGKISIPESIEVVRKKKTKSISVKDHLRGEVDVNGNALTFTLEALDTGSLRPDVFLDACMKETFGSDEHARVIQIMRIAQRSDDN